MGQSSEYKSSNTIWHWPWKVFILTLHYTAVYL